MATFFGRTLSDALGGVPIGLINASWGGTFIEAWMDADSQRGLSPAAVSTDAVSHPVAARYAWRNFTTASLFGSAGNLPVNSFRSANWEIDFPLKNQTIPTAR